MPWMVSCRGPGGRRSFRDVGGLSEDLREANRLQVADIPNKLYELGYELIPAADAVPSEIVITPVQLEILSRQGHERWMAERQRQGWTYGPTRDDAHKHDSSLVPWESLPESEKQKVPRADSQHSSPHPQSWISDSKDCLTAILFNWPPSRSSDQVNAAGLTQLSVPS